VPRRTSRSSRNDDRGRIAIAIAENPREFVGIVLAALATLTIFINALFLQHGPHPAPIFASRHLLPAPPPVPRDATAARTQVVSNIQRELARRGFYDGAVDGVWGAKTDAATRDFLAAAHLKLDPNDAGDALLRAIASSNVTATASAPAPARNDPIAALLAPSKRVLAVQRALADYGYGQLKPTGVVDPATTIAIEKFERDHRLPVTGQVSDGLVRALSAMTRRPLE
jgi:peptidoglycan hydrolase-like protein with peptidoglycan-binding domain